MNHCKRCFRHYPFTLGLRFLGLHLTRVINSICPFVVNNIETMAIKTNITKYKMGVVGWCDGTG